MKSRRLTQVDVTKLVGVSQAAVSQVLNHNDSIRPKETRQRILDAIDRLGYAPNTLAQSLGNLIAYLYNRYHEWISIMKNRHLEQTISNVILMGKEVKRIKIL